MFVAACEAAAQFTRPLLVSMRRYDGEVAAGIGAFVVVNADGWVVTAGHNLAAYWQRVHDQPLIQQYEEERATIESSHESATLKKGKLRQLKPNNEWLTNVSVWWSQDAVAPTEVYAYPELDLAVVRLPELDLSGVTQFPTFKKPNAQTVCAGTSLVKVGYPFHDVSSTFDEENDRFVAVPGVPPLFPIEGILTRVADLGESQDGFPIRLLETSSPGLRGQSGGPTLDKDGAIWAIQSRTVHYALGFRPEFSDGKRTVQEHQVLNVGVGVHVETIEAVLARHDVDANWTA